MNAEIVIALIVGLAAVVEDLKRRTISNWTPAAALTGGLICQVMRNGWWGIGMGAAGALSGFAVFLIFYLLGGMGGGDVKLMAGFGALLGVSRLLEAAFWIAVTGGLMAATLLGISWIRSRWKRESPGRASPRTIPYAPAIAFGVWLALIPKS